MARYRRTRLLSQDMKTGEFAYADQLIDDGYYPNLKVLPKNYEPPQKVGPSFRLPLEPMFNPSPTNLSDYNLVQLAVQVSQSTGLPIGVPTGLGSVGSVTTVVI